MTNNNSISNMESTFNWIEYTAFGSLLSLSALVGIYFGWYKGNQNTITEYMLGGRRMHVLPIAVSLISSHVSGVTLVGIPTEVYEFGAQYSLALSIILNALITKAFFLPVFYDLQLDSLYEYLELRFSKTVRLLTSFIYTMATLLFFIPIVIYIPSLAFNQVTGTSVHLIAPLICVLCIFYTTIGGLKAVVWTDTIQSVFTLGSVLTIVVLGVTDAGGLQRVVEINIRGERTNFDNFDINPYSRMTFWNTLIGGTMMWMFMLTVNPGTSQRFAALPSKKAAERSIICFGVGAMVISLLSNFVGMIMYAKYWNCDPIQSLNMKTSSKLLPYYVQQVAASFPGVSGIFISGLISAALSTMSAALNTLAGTFYQDFITLCLPKKPSQSKASLIVKIIVVIFGCTCVSMVYVIEKLGPILQMLFSLLSAPNSAIVSAFGLGIFFPWANRMGATVGMITSMGIIGWMATGAQFALMNKDLIFVNKPLSTSGCLANVTYLQHPFQIQRYEQVGQGVYAVPGLFFLYKIAFAYYIPIGTVIGIGVGLLVSLCTGGNDLTTVDGKLITPFMRRFLPKKSISQSVVTISSTVEVNSDNGEKK